MIGKAYLSRFLPEDGNASVEFVVLFPLVFALFVTSVDFSVQMLRQISLDRAVDIALRDVRLGRNRSAQDIKLAICDRYSVTTDKQTGCVANLTVELRPVQPQALRSEVSGVQCVDRAAEVKPVLEFTPGNQEQELMMVRVCRVSNPFIPLNAYLLGKPRGPNSDYMSVSVGFFVNEPA